MKFSKVIAFLGKHKIKIIAMLVVVALVVSLSNMGVLALLFRNSDSSAAASTTQPTATTSTAPQETLSPEEELELAADYLTQAIAEDPNDPELYTQRAAVYYNLGQTEAAVADYTSALALEEDPETRYLRAVVHTAVGNNQAAYEDLTVALKANPKNRDYLSLMADSCNSLQKYDESLTHLNTLLETEPENCILLTLAGDACVYLSDFEGSLPYYEKAIASHTDQDTKNGIAKANLYSAYGNSLKTLNQFPEAAVAYGQSLELADNNELYFQRGFCLLQSENYNDAIADFTKCIEVEYEVTFARFQRGLCYYALGRYYEAIEDFKVYEQAFPDKTDTWLYMGLCYQTLEYYSTAISYYYKCINANISPGTCYYNIGNCRYNLKEYSSAVENFTYAINYGSYVYEALLNRGISYIQLNKYNEAKVDLKRVIDECSNAKLVESATKSYEPIKNITIITSGQKQ